jgi:acyl-coenzyme A thioesterase PaaI-like protein
MKKLRNPFANLDGYNCFGCSPANPIGLQLSFTEDGDSITAEWVPGINYQGYLGILHGGIQATLMDEIASWTVYVKMNTAGFTSSAEFRYLHPVHLDRGPVTLRSNVKALRRNLADIEVALSDNTGLVCSRGILTFFTFPPEKAKIPMYAPSREEFYEQN